MCKVSFALLGLLAACGYHDPALGVDISDLPADMPAAVSEVTDVALHQDTVCVVADGQSRVLCGSAAGGLREVAALHGLVDVAVGESHVCADSLGEILCWDADSTHRVRTFPSATLVVSGDEHTCAVSNSGRASCIGSIAVDMGSMLTLSSAGGRVCGVTPARRVSCVGVGSAVGLLGQPRDAQALAISDSHSCVARGPDRAVACWGDNAFGQLGLDPTNAPFRNEPTDLDLRATTLALGDTFTCAMTAVRGEVLCWGESYGVEPVTITLPAKPMQIEARHARACAVLEDNTLACWRVGETPALVHYAK